MSSVDEISIPDGPEAEADPFVMRHCPSFAALQQLYEDRRDTLCDALRDALSRDPCETDWHALAQELHKLAGTAANFGDGHLGEAVQRLQQRLKGVDSPAACLCEEWPLPKVSNQAGSVPAQS